MAVPGGEDAQKSAAVCGEATTATRVKVLGMHLSARGAVTVGVGVEVPRRTDKGDQGSPAPALCMRVAVLVVIRTARRAWTSSDMVGLQ
jgi:hypothetical protein